jgi:hypothetical protein
MIHGKRHPNATFPPILPPAGAIFGGTAEIQKEIIVRNLGL